MDSSSLTENGSPSAGEGARHCVIEDNGRSWHQSPILVMTPPPLPEKPPMPAVLDLDILCATIAMQNESLQLEITAPGAAGVQRMWEGGVLNCFHDPEIALQTACCPCVTLGENVQRAGLGSCLGKGIIYFLMLVGAILSYALYLWTFRSSLFFLAVGFLVFLMTFAGYFRVQIRKKFNIKGSHTDSFLNALDDHLNHCFCGCCTLCQEARTLEMNNVQNGNWLGRGDTVLVGSYSSCDIAPSQPTQLKQPVVVTISSDSCHKDSQEHAWNQTFDVSATPLMAQDGKPR